MPPAIMSLPPAIINKMHMTTYYTFGKNLQLMRIIIAFLLYTILIVSCKKNNSDLIAWRTISAGNTGHLFSGATAIYFNETRLYIVKNQKQDIYPILLINNKILIQDREVKRLLKMDIQSDTLLTLEEMYVTNPISISFSKENKSSTNN